MDSTASQLFPAGLSKFLSDAFNAYPDPLFIKDRDLRYLFANEAFAKFIDVPIAQILGQDDFTLLAPEVAAACRANDTRALELQTRNGEMFPFESEETYGLGEEKRILQVRRYVLFDSQGQMNLFGAVRDVTETLRKENRLRTSLHASETLRRETQRQLGDVLEMIDEVVWSLQSGTWETLFISPAAERVYGRPISVLLQKEEWAKVFPAEENLRIMREMEYASMSGNETFSGDFRFIHPEKGERMAFIRGRIVRDADGIPIRIDGMTTDVTENRRALKELEENRQKLFALSKLHTLGELASGIGHEINTPLTGILSKIARAERTVSKPTPTNADERATAARLLRESMEIVGRVSEIVDGLKQLSRNQQKEDLERFDPLVAVDQALSLSRARFSNHGYRLEIERPKEKKFCFGKPTTLFQSLVNLLNNAFDSLEQKTAQNGWNSSENVVLRVESVDDRVVIRVIDSGVGIPEDFKPKLFEAFQTTKAEGKGTGLGLSISRRLLRAQGGDLRLVSSKPGRTEFEILLPESR
jgi:C4-dicarboxylate-specific signal transduction histidine kinase